MPASRSKRRRDTSGSRSTGAEPKPTKSEPETQEAKEEAKDKQQRQQTAQNEGNDHAETVPDSKASKSLDEQNKNATQEDSQENLPNEEAPSEQEKVKQLLEHRKLLLRRITQCKSAAKKRLDDIYKNDPKSKSLTDEQEIANYLALAKEATATARRQSKIENEQQTERKTSVSLRRGASVGKKMNAALSSLAPGAGLTFEEDEDEPAYVAPKAAAATSTGGAGAVAASSSTVPVVSAGVPATLAPKAPNVGLSASLVGGVTSSPMIAPKAAPSQQNRAVPRKGPQQGVPRGIGGSSPGVKLAPQGGMSGQSSPSRSIPPHQPLVVCRDASLLREKKKSIERKLASVLESRYRRIEREKQQLQQSPLPSLSPKAATEVPADLVRAAIEGPGRPTQLPRRRKTHWDYVLEEMQWLATDFREERKWKECTGKLLADAVVQKQTVDTSGQSSEPPREKADTVDSDEVMEDRSASSGEEADADVTSKQSEEKSKAGRLYPEVTDDDSKSARTVARVVSSMVLELSTAIEHVGVSAQTYQEFTNALQRHNLARRKLEGDESIMSENNKASQGQPQTEDNAIENETEQSNQNSQSPDPDGAQSAAAVSDDGLERDKLFQQFSDVVDKAKSKMDKYTPKSKVATTLSGLSIELSPGQAKAIDRIEDNWGRVGCGAVLGGTVSSGKTITACTLLWKKRSDGPQLLFCSHASLVRWMHEISRFEDLHRRPLGFDVGISAPSLKDKMITEYGANDVVLCEYAALSQFSKESLSKFCTIIVDLRFPMGFFGSRKPVCGEETTEIQNSVVGLEIPSELASSSWWAKLSSVSLGLSVNRLLIDCVEPTRMSRCRFDISERQLLELLGLRFLFLLGEANFQVQHLKKSVLAWARRRIKSLDGGGSKFERVKKLFLDLSDSFFCKIDDGILLDTDDFDDNAEWEIQDCELTPKQLTVYGKICTEYRAWLSAKLESNFVAKVTEMDPLRAAVDALMRLRRVCIHADSESILSGALHGSLNDFMVRQLHRKTGGGPSQTNVELAASILEGSCKMKGLLSILLHQCELEIVDREFVLECVGDETKKSKQKRHSDRPRRIAILAALPEAQLLVSLLLNAVGIEHELLLEADKLQTGSDASTRFAEDREISWAQSQLILSKFNDEGGPDNDGSPVSIVVASPVTIAGDNVGLGVELADLVVCVDEDWSGRSELQLRSLALRCLARNDEGCRFIKLIAAKSCEASFMNVPRSGIKKDTEGHSWPCPLDAFGSFTCENWSKVDEPSFRDAWLASAPRDNGFSFPACNILALREEKLSDVLVSTEPVDCLMPSESALLFLPRKSPDVDDVKVEARALALLVDVEVSSWSKVRLNQDEKSRSYVPSSVIPPRPLDRARNLIGRADLLVISTRLYLERLYKHVTESEHGVASPTSTLPIALVGSGTLLAEVDVGEEMIVSQREKQVEQPEKFVESMLFYPGQLQVESGRSSISVRFNAYSSVFGRRQQHDMQEDGSTGAEGLVYFPPLFPRVLECSRLAKQDVESLRSQRPVRSYPNGDDRKRSSDGSSEQEAKRPRLDSGSEGNGSSVLAFYDPAKDPPLITEDEASHGDAASVLLDLTDDYGLVGIGAVPLPRDSALSAGTSVAGWSWGQSIGAGSSDLHRYPCDIEEARLGLLNDGRDGGSDSMILFVSRKRPRGYSGPPSGQGSLAFTRQGYAGQFANSLFPSANIHLDTNGAARKPKNGPGGVSAFNRPSLNDSRQTSQILKDSNVRNRLLMMSRHSGTGTSLFQAPLFQAASARVRSRVTDQLARHCWTSSSAFEIGPGLPLHISKQLSPTPMSFREITLDVDQTLWTSVVKRLKTKSNSTGDEAIEMAAAQLSTLGRSAVAPCRVDFGPFQAGFLSSTSGMTIVPPPRSRAGVCLPMGVKIGQLQKGGGQRPWSTAEDDLLQASVERFGMNWTLVSRRVTGFEDNDTSLQQDSRLRSGRECRDRWQTVVRSRSKLSKEELGHVIRELDGKMVAVDNPGYISPLMRNDKAGVEFLMPIETGDSDPTEEKMEVDSEKPMAPKWSFSAMRAAKAKKQTVQMSIPGVVSGSPPTVVPSHPSHMQSVQSSVAAVWTSGRTEMWPLQLLDAADRQRAAVSSAAAAATGVPPPPPPPATARQASTSSRTHTPPQSNTTSSRAPSTGTASNHAAATSASSQASASQRPPPNRASAASIQSFIPPTQQATSSQPTSQNQSESRPS